MLPLAHQAMPVSTCKTPTRSSRFSCRPRPMAPPVTSRQCITRADSGITSIEQLEGKSLAYADPNSTSGYLVPRFELKRAGYE